MENRSKSSFINSKKLGRNIFSSYDNDTFVPDQDFEIVKRTSNSLEDILTEKGFEEKQKCDCKRAINIDTAIIYENQQSEYSSSCSCKCEDVDNQNIRNVKLTLDNNQNISDTENIDDRDEINSLEPNELKNLSPPLSNESISHEGNKRTRKTSGTNQSSRNKSTPRKIRSFSDTRNPLLFHRLNPKLRQLEEVDAEKTDTVTSITVLSKQDELEEKVNNDNEIESTDPEKSKRNKRWMRKLAKYASFDEGICLSKPNKSGNDLSPTSENIEHTDDTKSENNEPFLKESTSQRKISTGKMIKQSMSHGFSKFKQLSISGKSGNRKFEQDYAMIDNDVDLHETSKRQPETLPNIFDADKALSHNLFRRCSSLPDLLDTSSICDEEINDLYLPRRMAICPDLAVPAMKQLRTYLVLTRLKQYCIV